DDRGTTRWRLGRPSCASMTRRALGLTGRARAEGDPEELVAWCAATADLITFREALRRISAERWPSVRSRVAGALAETQPRGVARRGEVADRARRARSAARSLKLGMLEQETAARATRDPDARARRRLAWLGDRPGSPDAPPVG